MDSLRDHALMLSPLLWLAPLAVFAELRTPGCERRDGPRRYDDCSLLHPWDEVLMWACLPAAVIHLAFVIYNLVSDRREGF